MGEKKSRRPSLRLHLFLAILFVGMVPLLLASWVLLNTTLDKEIASSAQEMQGQALVLANELSSFDYFQNPVDATANRVIEQTADIWGGRIQVIDCEFRIIHDTYAVDAGKYNISEYVIRCLRGEAISSVDSSRQYIAFTQPVYQKESRDPAVDSISAAAVTNGAESKRIQGVLLVTVDLQGVVTPVAETTETALIVCGGTLLVLILLGLVLTSFWANPLNRLGKEIEKVAEGGLKNHVNVRNYKEIARISDSFNTTLDRLRMLDESRQEFVSNVSHELKTPITSIRVLADSLISMGEGAPVELYREFMTDISDEIDRESKIIDDLLAMVRLDNKDQTLNIAQVSINDMMELLLKRLRPIAKERDIEILFESFRPVTAEVDEVKLNLAITNLVENAIKYNRDGGWVKASLNADHQFFYIKITDSGCGIPREALGHIFERFYRVDKARSRETGGTGLGLAITRTIIQLHHGAIRVHSKEQEGTTFIVRIPLIYIKE